MVCVTIPLAVSIENMKSKKKPKKTPDGSMHQ